ncbi:MAG: hypothetical protein WC603_00995 [Candidatus Paceibacterota bacterium]|jgi:hypothetical protein
MKNVRLFSFFAIIIMMIVATSSASAQQTRIERKFNRHFYWEKPVFLSGDSISEITPNIGQGGTFRTCIIYSFKKHTSQRLVLKFAEYMNYTLPKKSDLKSLIAMKHRSLFLDYNRIIGYNYDQFLGIDYDSGEKTTPYICFKNNQWSVGDIIVKVEGRRGYQTIFFEYLPWWDK